MLVPLLTPNCTSHYSFIILVAQNNPHLNTSLRSLHFCQLCIIFVIFFPLISSSLFVSVCVCVVQPAGLVSHSDLDDRAIEALKEFNEEGALQVLLQFKDSDLSHVQVCMQCCCWCYLHNFEYLNAKSKSEC